MGVTNFNNLDEYINDPKKPKGSKEYPNPTNFNNIPELVPGRPKATGDRLFGLTTDFGSSQYDDYSDPVSTVDQLGNLRSERQPFISQIGNMLGQAVAGEIVGGTFEGLGYALDLVSILDLMKGEEAEFGNFMTKFGQSIRKGTEENLRIYEDPNAHGFSKMLDTGWWTSGLVSTASTFSMLIPTMGVMKAASLLGKGISATRGMRALKKAGIMAKELGHKGKWIRDGVSQAVVSRNIENWMEAHGTFEDMKAQKMTEINPKTLLPYTEEEATQIAGKAASSNYKKGWAMLLQDIPQFLAMGRVFNPATGRYEGALADSSARGIIPKMKPWQEGVYKKSKTNVGAKIKTAKLKANLDAGYITQKEYDKRTSDLMGSEGMVTSGFFGGLGGNLHQAAGSYLKKVLRSDDQKKYEENLEEAFVNIKNRSKQLKSLYQDMSEEDAENYKKVTGDEFSRELAKEAAPRLQKMALDVRDKYLKHRDKHSKGTASRLALLESHNEGFSEKVKESRKAYENIKKNMGQQFDLQATDRLRNRLELREKGQVLKLRKKALEERLKKASEYEKPFIQVALDNNETLLKQQKKDEQKQRQETLDRTPQDKEIDERREATDKAAEKIYKRLHQKDLS